MCAELRSTFNLNLFQLQTNRSAFRRVRPNRLNDSIEISEQKVFSSKAAQLFHKVIIITFFHSQIYIRSEMIIFLSFW